MKSGARIALAVGFGYVLGRRRKLRTALTLAAAVAAGRASQQPGGLKQVAGNLLGATPQLGNLGKLGAPLVTAGKAAATAAAGSGIDAVSGKLRGSADALRRRSAGQSGEQQADDEERSAPDEEQELDEQPEARDDEDRDGEDRDGESRDDESADEDRAERRAPAARRRGR